MELAAYCLRIQNLFYFEFFFLIYNIWGQVSEGFPIFCGNNMWGDKESMEDQMYLPMVWEFELHVHWSYYFFDFKGSVLFRG